MTPDNTIIPLKYIQGMIFTIRGVPVMVDRDLADIYQVENKRLNEQVKRNLSRFPEAFRFQLTDAEKEQLVANCDRFDSMKHASSNPYVFTEQGVSMPSALSPPAFIMPLGTSLRSLNPHTVKIQTHTCHVSNAV